MRRAGAHRGRNIVVHFRVAVEREPFADEGKPVREVECAKAGAGILRSCL
jgi:hypothetical protein